MKISIITSNIIDRIRSGYFPIYEINHKIPFNQVTFFTHYNFYYKKYKGKYFQTRLEPCCNICQKKVSRYMGIGTLFIKKISHNKFIFLCKKHSKKYIFFDPYKPTKKPNYQFSIFDYD